MRDSKWGEPPPRLAAGLIDKDGRILEADKHRGKLYSVEQALAQTENGRLLCCFYGPAQHGGGV